MKPKRFALQAVGWVAFGLGWAGVFLPGLPTTILWIVAALAFLRTNEAAYRRVVSNKRFGPAVRLFVEEGRISARGKIVSIAAMMACALLGTLAIPPYWAKMLVVVLAVAGSVWVGTLPTPESRDPAADRIRAPGN